MTTTKKISVNHKAYFEVLIQNKLQNEYLQKKFQNPGVLFVCFRLLIGGERKKDKQNKSLEHCGINDFLPVLALYNFESQT